MFKNVEFRNFQECSDQEKIMILETRKRIMDRNWDDTTEISKQIRELKNH